MAQLRTSQSHREVAHVVSPRGFCWLRPSSLLFLFQASLSSVEILMTNLFRKLDKISNQSWCQALLSTSQWCHSAFKSFKLTSWMFGARPISLSWRATRLWSVTSAKHLKYLPKLSHLHLALVGLTNQLHNRTCQAQLRKMMLWPLRLRPEMIWKYYWTPSPSYETATHIEFLHLNLRNLFPYKALL